MLHPSALSVLSLRREGTSQDGGFPQLRYGPCQLQEFTDGEPHACSSFEISTYLCCPLSYFRNFPRPPFGSIRELSPRCHAQKTRGLRPTICDATHISATSNSETSTLNFPQRLVVGSFPGGIHRRERMADQSSAIFRTLNTCGFVPPICSSFIKSKWALATADATGLGTPMPRLRLDFAEWMHAFSPHWFSTPGPSLYFAGQQKHCFLFLLTLHIVTVCF